MISAVIRPVGRGAIACALAAFAAGPAPACGGPEEACAIDGGSYHIALPEDAGAGPAAVMFLHGFGGRGAWTLGNKRLTGPLLARGYAVIAPNGQPMDNREGLRWSFLPSRPSARDEAAFLMDVRRDAARRHGVDAERVILAGFSNGAFMTTYLACDAPQSFAAFAPVAGVFWRPHPDRCVEAPRRYLLTHGWDDVVVPLEGRPLGGGRFEQGDVFRSLAILREASGCADDTASSTTAEGGLWRRVWADCAPGGHLELLLFDGGHTLPDFWPDRIVDWFEALPAGD